MRRTLTFFKPLTFADILRMNFVASMEQVARLESETRPAYKSFKHEYLEDLKKHPAYNKLIETQAHCISLFIQLMEHQYGKELCAARMPTPKEWVHQKINPWSSSSSDAGLKEALVELAKKMMPPEVVKETVKLMPGKGSGEMYVIPHTVINVEESWSCILDHLFRNELKAEGKTEKKRELQKQEENPYSYGCGSRSAGGGL